MTEREICERIVRTGNCSGINCDGYSCVNKGTKCPLRPCHFSIRAKEASNWLMDHPVKPPLGIKPKYKHDEQRMHNLGMAIARRIEFRGEIPEEWVEEYNVLVAEY